MQNETTSRSFRRHALVAAFLSAILAFSLMPSFVSAHAVTSAEKQAEADALIAQLDGLQTQLNEANAAYESAVEAQEEAKAAMDDAQKRIEESEDRIETLQDRLGGRATEMYKTGGTMSFIDVVLGASSFEEFLTTWDAVETITNKDAELVSETKQVRQEAQDAHDEYTRQEARAAEEVTKAADAKSRVETTTASMQQRISSITAEVASLQAAEELQAEQARQAAEAAAQAQAAQAAAGVIAAPAASSSSSSSDSSSGSSSVYNEGASVVSGSGVFTHPCPGASISSTFGYRDFDSSFHKGLDLAASEGTPFYAADAGTVLMATSDGGYNGGAGNWVVISHGNGLVTKYMHASATYVTPGQSVSRGQNIGAVGNTGNSFGAHLHFQVEVDGTAVDPTAYL